MANINYVRFLRGTPTSYEKLKEYDSNTLYFISEKNAKTGVLYLGDKILSDSTSLNSLINVGIEDAIVEDGDFLVYDKEKNTWVSKSVNDLDLGNNTNIYTAAIQENENHSDAINRAIGEDEISKGDFVILTKSIDNTHTEYTAYVYNGTNWQAMDGNYNAENVYFSSDLITTSNVGNISISNSGSATINAAGKNLKELWEQIFITEKNPIITKPFLSITLNGAGSYEVGTVVSPKYSTSFNSGNYSYGPSTDIIAESYTVTFNNETKNEKDGTFSDIQVNDSTNLQAQALASYSTGSIPLTNLGNEYKDGQILSGNTLTVTSSAITGYRNSFYGTFSSKEESIDVRSLTPTERALSNGDVINLSIPVGAMRVVFAYPAVLQDITSIVDINGLNAEIKSSFKKILQDVEGANGYTAQSYKVYYLDYANPIDVANVYKITI